MAWTMSGRSGNATGVTLMSTDLNSLSISAGVVSSVGGTSGLISNTSEKDQLVDLYLAVDYVSAPTADGAISVYFLPKYDGTNFEDASSSITPNRPPDAVFAVRNTTAAQIMSAQGVRVPPQDFKILLVNGTSQAFPASGSTLVGIFYS